jgi:hypothetical protein
MTRITKYLALETRCRLSPCRLAPICLSIKVLLFDEQNFVLDNKLCELNLYVMTEGFDVHSQLPLHVPPY